MRLKSRTSSNLTRAETGETPVPPTLAVSRKRTGFAPAIPHCGGMGGLVVYLALFTMLLQGCYTKRIVIRSDFQALRQHGASMEVTLKDGKKLTTRPWHHVFDSTPVSLVRFAHSRDGRDLGLSAAKLDTLMKVFETQQREIDTVPKLGTGAELKEPGQKKPRELWCVGVLEDSAAGTETAFAGRIPRSQIVEVRLEGKRYLTPAQFNDRLFGTYTVQFTDSSIIKVDSLISSVDSARFLLPHSHVWNTVAASRIHSVSKKHHAVGSLFGLLLGGMAGSVVGIAIAIMTRDESSRELYSKTGATALAVSVLGGIVVGPAIGGTHPPAEEYVFVRDDER